MSRTLDSVESSPSDSGGTRLMLISADCHAGPPTMRDYRDYVEARDLDDFDEYCAAIEEHERTHAKSASGGANLAQPRDTDTAADHHELQEGLWDAQVRRRYLDAEGLAGEVIFPQGSVPFAPYPAIAGFGGTMEYQAPVELRNAGPGIYNRWLADFCSTDPERHAGVAVVPIRHPEQAAAEVKRARAAGLFGGISLPPVSEEFPKYNDRCYDPLWAACEESGMPINLHGGAGKYYGPGPESIALILTETDWFSHRALWFLIFSGVFERFPGLRLAITEQRVQWVEPTLKDLDSVFDTRSAGALRETLSLRPSEYFARNCFIGASFFSKPECDMRHGVGVTKIMWGSDYPHNEGTWPWTSESLRWTFSSVPAEEIQAMVGGNAARCYDFDTQRLQGLAERIGPSLGDVQRPIEYPARDRDLGTWAFRRTGPFS